MATTRIRLILITTAMLFSFAAFAKEKSQQYVDSKEKCPVCGMFVAKFPDWIATVSLADGKKLYFDGVKDMFSFVQQPEKYLQGKTKSGITAVMVKDYYSLKDINGKDAYFVVGSDVQGPMGSEFVPLGKRSDAEGFMKDHKGKKILRFGEVTSKSLKDLQ